MSAGSRGLKRGAREGAGAASSDEDDAPAKATKLLELISKQAKNYDSVVRDRSSAIRSKFGRMGEALTRMRVPDEFRAQAKAKGMWLQAKRTGDRTGTSATELLDSATDINAEDLSISRAPKSGTQEILDMQIGECQDRVRAIKENLKKMKNVDSSSKTAKSVVKTAQLQEELKLALVALNESEIRKRIHDYKKSEKMEDKREERFTKYLDKCVSMIGFLQDMCSELLIEEMSANTEYLCAIDEGDTVKVGYLIKSFVTEADDPENVVRERTRRFFEITSTLYSKGESFSGYADNIVKKYKEYSDLCDNAQVSKDSEEQMVHAIVENTKWAFRSVTDVWMSFKVGDSNAPSIYRPTTVLDLIGHLNVLERRLNHGKEEEISREKPKDAEQSELLKVMKAFIGRASSSKYTAQQEKRDSDECFAFSRDGSCRFGDKCHFNHIDKTKSPGEAVKYCVNILKYGNCRAKEGCPHFKQHEASYKKALFDAKGNRENGKASTLA
jgi:hypothetical protein